MKPRLLPLLVLAALAALVLPAPAQGGRDRPTVRPTPPPRRIPGRGPAPRTREGAARVDEAARDRTGRWARLRRIEERVDPEEEPGKPGKKDEGGGAGKGRKLDKAELRRLGRELIGHLRRDAGKVRDVEIAWAVRVLLAEGGQRQLDVKYRALRVDDKEIRHRFDVWEVSDGPPRRSSAWLVHEGLGGAARVWRIEPGKSPTPVRVGELAAGLAGTRLRLLDLLPFDPGRFRLTYEGRDSRGGKEVHVFDARDRLAPGETLEVALDVDRRLVVKAEARAGGRTTRTMIAQGLRVRSEIAAFERRSLRFGSSGDQAVAKMVKRVPNGGLDARLFEVATFEF